MCFVEYANNLQAQVASYRCLLANLEFFETARNQLCIRTMLAVDHAVRNNTGEKRLNRRKHRDRKRIWNRRLNQFHVKNRQMKHRKQEPVQ